MLNYELQLTKFAKIAAIAELSSDVQTLYFQLMSQFKYRYFPDSLKLDNITLHNCTQLPFERLRRARAKLQKLELISYTSGGGSAPGEYIIFDLSKKEYKNLVTDVKRLNLLPDVKIASKIDILKSFEQFPKENKFYAEFIYRVLEKALKNQQTGIYANEYMTAIDFLKASTELTIPFIFKLTETFKYKPDIENKEAYVLACLTNFTKELRRKRA